MEASGNNIEGFTVRLLRNGGQADWQTAFPPPPPKISSSSFTVDKIKQQGTQLPVMSLVPFLFAVSGCFPEGKKEVYSRISSSLVVYIYRRRLNNSAEAEHYRQTLQ
jgi:hypothetical protein